MPEIVIQGIPIRFPFEPYDVQRDYMTKVIESLQTNSNGALESPTGTGKTLCLLCATLGWLEFKKANIQADYANAARQGLLPGGGLLGAGVASTPLEGTTPSAEGGAGWGAVGGMPKIIYSSRTHSQLSQAVAELKRTSYSYMKVAVLGSRDQLCIHPEVSKEVNNSTKLHMCQIRVKSKTCYFHNQVEGKKDDPYLKTEVLDLEDLVKYGKRRTCCPYYLARDLRLDADIIFMPYNYLLDPRTRKAHGIELQGYVVILDEAHNVEKMCEEAASLQLRSTDIAMCIDEVTQVMQKMQDSGTESEAFAANDPGAGEGTQDFHIEDLYILKTLFLQFEKAIDEIVVRAEGQSYPGSYMFDLLEKAEITPAKKPIICDLLDKLVQYLTSNSSSPFQRKGAGLQKFSDLVKIVFSKDNFTVAHMDAIKKSYKVHVAIEDPKKRGGWGGGGGGGGNKGGGWGDAGNKGGWGDSGNKGAWGDSGNKGGWGDSGNKGGWGDGGNKGGWGDGGNNKGGGWGGKGGPSKEQSNTLTSKQGRVLSYWCFNPGFGMKELCEQGLRSLIITSGTLSPLQSFVEELQVGFPVQLENPHIIQGHQVLVAVVSKGPDGHLLNSSYQNRSRPEYLNSLGQLVLNFSKVIPGGLLVFFPSYPIMRSCHEHWQNRGIWEKIIAIKAAFIEPQGKDGFTSTMHDFYEKVNDPALRGAIFMAVCRGKVSEGLDFADGNGRAVIITGLPYPPFKDPRVMLKQQYLDNNQRQEKRGQSGQTWYKLEASRAVNQAIGRVIRHKDDYGAILLADHRFGIGGFSQQLSKWVQPHLKVYQEFGPTMRDLTRFFRAALTLLPQPEMKNKFMKDGGTGAKIIPKYDPLPGAPVPSSAFSQTPSRLVAKYKAADLSLMSSYTNSSSSAVDDQLSAAAGGSAGCCGGGRLTSSGSSCGSSSSCGGESRAAAAVKIEYSSGPLSVLDSLNEEAAAAASASEVKNEVIDLEENGTEADTCHGKKRTRSDENSSGVLDFNYVSKKKESSGKSKYGDLCSLLNKKRKIRVTANVSSADQNAPLPSATDAATASTEARPLKEDAAEKVKKIALYVKEVKRCLEPAQYAEFSATCRLYRAEKDYNQVLAVLLRIFKDKDKHQLLRKFSAFLTPEHRKDFAASCAAFTS